MNLEAAKFPASTHELPESPEKLLDELESPLSVEELELPVSVALNFGDGQTPEIQKEIKVIHDESEDKGL